MPQKLSAVLFDMDGLMIDSEKGGVQACRQAGEEMGLSADQAEAFAIACIGSNKTRSRELFSSFFPHVSYDEFSQRSHAIRMHLRETEGTPVKEGLLPLLHYLYDHHCPAGVVTSTAKNQALPQLETLGLCPFFTAFTFGDEVPRSKPFPDIYLEGAKRLRVPPQECLVLEDSHNGIRAAHAAGMIPVMIPDLVPPTEDIRALCFRILPSLHKIPELLRTAFSL